MKNLEIGKLYKTIRKFNFLSTDSYTRNTYENVFPKSELLMVLKRKPAEVIQFEENTLRIKQLMEINPGLVDKVKCKNLIDDFLKDNETNLKKIKEDFKNSRYNHYEFLTQKKERISFSGIFSFVDKEKNKQGSHETIIVANIEKEKLEKHLSKKDPPNIKLVEKNIGYFFKKV